MPVALADTTIRSAIESNLGPGWEVVAFVTAIAIHAALLINVFGVAPFFFIWAERKVAGRIQDRLGPTRVGGGFGWLQSLADGVKLIQKEDLVPKDADGTLFRMAPYLTCIASFGAFIVLPFNDGWVAVAADVGIFLLFAILSLEVLGIVLAGYSSGSKWSLFGGIREAAQMVSYEIPLAITGLVPIVAVGSLNLSEIGRVQNGGIQNWLLFNDPFTFFAFFVYFVVATAGCKRAPFDLAEAESELVGGFHTEYSGMRWSFFFLAEYASMFLVSVVAAILFLGGWHSGLPAVFENGIVLFKANFVGGPDSWLGGYLLNLFGMTVLILKASALVFVQIWVRWTLPRLRIDQVMVTCLKYLIPISCVLFLGAVIWPLAMYKMTDGATTRAPGHRPLGAEIVPAESAAAPTDSDDAGEADQASTPKPEDSSARIASAGKEAGR